MTKLVEEKETNDALTRNVFTNLKKNTAKNTPYWYNVTQWFELKLLVLPSYFVQ